MKAFVSSLVVIVVSALLLELLFSFQAFNTHAGTFQEQMFAVKYADYYYDDITYDVRSLVPNDPSLRRVNSTAVAIGFTDNPANFSFADALNNYSRKIQPVAQKLNINVSLDTSNVTSGDFVLSLSNGVVYDAQYDQNGRTTLTNSDASSAAQYDFIYFFNMTENSLNTFNLDQNPAPDDIRVTMNYTDANGSVFQDGNLSSSGSHVFQANFANLGQFAVHIQKLTSQPASLYIVKDGVPGSYTHVSATLDNNGTYEVYATLPVLIHVSGLTFSKGGYLEVFRV